MAIMSSDNPITTIVRLGKLVVASTGQTEEVDSLAKVLKGGMLVFQLASDTFERILKNKPAMNTKEQHNLMKSSYRTMTDGLNRFYEIKERKIRTYIEYLSEIGLTTNDEKAEIDKIGKGWQNARNSISAFQKKLERSDFVAISNLNTGTDFKDELTEYTQQIIEPLEKLEQRLRTRTLDQIRVIINSNQQSMPSGSKFFFDLFTKSPYN